MSMYVTKGDAKTPNKQNKNENDLVMSVQK
jgi:hypothetical protein